MRTDNVIIERIYYYFINIRESMEEWQQVLITVIGWVYFSAWSISFYGQIFENFRRKRYAQCNVVLRA